MGRRSDKRRSEKRGKSKSSKRVRRERSPSRFSRNESPDRTSESSSSERETTLLKRQLKVLQREINDLKNRPSTSTASGDEFLIPTFDPSKEDASIEKWIDKVESLAARYAWNEDYIVRLMGSRLKGNARQWFYEQTQNNISWSNMKRHMKDHFRKSVPFCKLLKEASNYEARPGQDLGDYCFQKLSKLRALNLKIPEEYLVDAVIGGIPDENISRTVRSAQHTNSDLLYSYLNTLGKMAYDNRSHNSANNLKFHTNFKQHFGHKNSAQGNRSVTCYNCKLPGHVMKDCRKPLIKCHNCNKIGHLSKDCSVNTKPANINEIISGPALAEHMFIKPVVVQGHKCLCLIDTGSSRTLLKMSIAKRHSFEIKETRDICLRSFMGSSILSKNVTNISIRIMEALAEIEAILVDDEYLLHDLIVGRDFLDQNHIVMIKKSQSVIFRTLPVLNSVTVNVVDAYTRGVINIEDISIGTVLNTTKISCVNLLNEFSDCISSSMQNLGKTKTIYMEIKTTSDEPIVYNPYRLPELEKTILRNIIIELLENNIIRESDSSYASPVLLVKKKTNDYRMCVDYRKLNAITIKNRYPLPLIEEQIDRLGGFKSYILLDLAHGFYQVPIAENSISKTAFVTPDGHFEFLRMPFGLSNGPAVFQRLINTVLGSLRNTIAHPYIDDIIIPAVNEEQGLERLRQVLERFREHNLTLKLSKCSFFQDKIDYLGREISRDGVKPGKKKSDAVLCFPVPRNVKQVRQFLGLSGYFRNFIKDYAKIVLPLTYLTRKNINWQWTDNQSKAFNKIKEILTKEPVLAIFDPSKGTELHTDGSSRGVGGILLQTNESGQQQVVSYFSKQTTVDQRQYHSYELETMAVVFALRYFRVYLIGIPFKLVTDCNALRTTLSKKDLLPRVGRWWLEIQDFVFHIEYRPGSKMCHVDALSRNPIQEATIHQIDVTEDDWIVCAQLEDDQLSRVRKILEEGQINSESKHYFQEYELKNNKLYRKLHNGKTAWVVPKLARMQICRLCHDETGHLGIEKTLRRIQSNYWFPKMRRFVTKYIKACLHCAYYKNTPHKNEGKLHPIEKVPVPFHTIHVDHVGPFVTSKKKNKFILVIVDGFTKFCIIEPVKDQSSKHVIKILTNLIYVFGTPSRIVSDRGTAFTSNAFKDFCENYGIRHILNAVATPRSNGQCERYNRTILSALSSTSAGKKPNKWDRYVKTIQISMNTSFNKSIDATPMEALLGYNTKHPADSRILSTIQTDLRRLDLVNLRQDISSHISEDQRKQKERYDKTRKDAVQYKVGDLVMLKITSEANTGASKKLLPKYKGPFRILKVLLNDRYELEDLRHGFKRNHTVAAFDNIKQWITIQDDSPVDF